MTLSDTSFDTLINFFLVCSQAELQLVSLTKNMYLVIFQNQIYDNGFHKFTQVQKEERV